ncbi:hypothetical protein SPRG_07965 [Saprolegnia parasitica CBS 223.65]|uniref:Cytochrome P450 n=1 Tax=Saprolegnia parasitica (strain CBS 223.65) TaxID=695850 RepID=A0A067CIC6_SAPPC|nr:hypothetical protein SPRG_07965 [Saprolegnia parasitica CBS 223.65]KDO26562.1 hypothetical protein SPRG_07965 [Saprolegnia parasitica CBS 223.65]|eukprot:XP_012202704.1 hypothetical protein SPRG_07965 [Saprolegnia parasitica CBS 223.65]
MEGSVMSAGAAILVIVVAYVYHRYGRNAPFLPGLPFPAGLHRPFVGVAVEMSTLEGMTRLFVDAADANGMVSFRLLSQPSVAVTRADHVRQVYMATTNRGPTPIIDMHMQAFLGDRSVSLLMRDEWKLHRRLVSRAFQWQNLAAMVPAMASIAETFTNVWRGAATPSIDVFPLLKRLALDTIGRTGFGYDMGALRDAANPMASALDFLVNEINRRCLEQPLHPSSHLYWLPTRTNRRHAEAVSTVRTTLHSIIQARMMSHATSSLRHHDLLEAMLEAASADNSPMDAKTLADNVVTFFFAGSDTTSSAMAYTLFLLATHRDVQAKAVAEIDKVVGQSSPITYEAMQQLPYVSAVLTEALRLYAPAPFTYRHADSDLVLGDHVVPAGTLLALPMWFINRSPLNWGDDAAEFKPERHLAADCDRFAAKDRAYRFVSFSGGPRNCVGMRFAQLEATVLLTTILRQCIVTRPSDAPSVEPTAVGISITPEGGMWLSLTPRAAVSA